MSGGLYNTHKADYETTNDLTRLKAYGDTMNDSKVKFSFTLPDKNAEGCHILCCLRLRCAYCCL